MPLSNPNDFKRHHTLLAENFKKYLPLALIPALMQEIEPHDLRVRIVKPRKTRYGTYCYFPTKSFHEITINNDLKGDAFLIVFLHELAHLHTQKKTLERKYKTKPMAHGPEWKENFALLLQRFHLKTNNNNLRSCADEMEIFSQTQEGIAINDIGEGEYFIFREKTYQKLHNLRTQALCLCVKTQQKYKIHRQAKVQTTRV